jgi:UDP-N-acetyl-2-amino-2-deoxyglucuronate dehydrogenase
MITHLKFAIIGCGRIAERHASHIQKMGILICVCDIIEERASEFATRYNAKAYGIPEKMLHENPTIDIVAICTPNGLHAIHSIIALKAGCHVLCEKPMALTVQDCEEMIITAKHANKYLFIVKQNRFNPPVAAVKKAIDEDRLGKIFSIQLSCFWNRNNDYYQDWKGTATLDGGTLFTQFSHFIDLLFWIVGDVKAVNAYTANYHHKNIIEFEDTGVAVLKFNSGAMGTINYSVNSFRKNMEGSLTIVGEKGIVRIGGEYLNKLDYQNIENFVLEDLPLSNSPNDYGTYIGSMSNHDKVYQQMIDIVMNKKTVLTNELEGLKTVEIINKIYVAAKNNIMYE